MIKQIPKSRFYLQKLTHRIERLEQTPIIGHVATGTGVRAASKDTAAWFKKQDRLRDLRHQRHLVEAGLIEILDAGQEAEIRLTKDGVIAALKDRIVLEKTTLDDGWLCFVVFDIPEDVRELRKSFCRFLKSGGFRQLQRSVWVSQKDVVKDLSALIKQLKIGKWVRVYVAHEND